MNYYKSKSFTLPFSFGILGLIAIATSKIIELSTGTKIHQIAWLASAFILTSTLIIRFYTLDAKSFDDLIQETNPLKDKPLPSSRYIKWFTIALVIGLGATITIHFHFIFGMLAYLLMQIALMIAFSGIIHMNPKITLKSEKFRKMTLISMVFWVVLIVFVYVFFVYSGSDSLIVIPYVMALGTMAHFTWNGLAYTGRSIIFRAMLVAGSFIFVFSDALIGNNVYGVDKVSENLYHTIDITYVLNIFLLTQAVLFLKKKE